MSKTILITGSTDGIGLLTAQKLLEQGHKVLLHGRNPHKISQVKKELSKLGSVESYMADLSNLQEVISLANNIFAKHKSLNILINNAGVFNTPNTQINGIDTCFIVNTIAPYILTKKLLPLLNNTGRVINLSSAAQAPIDINTLTGQSTTQLDPMSAYAQSKLAITIWSKELANELKNNGPAIIAINPGSLLGSKMVKEGFGMEGKDLNIGADILLKAALLDEFASASGQYFDNDSGAFANPHSDINNSNTNKELMKLLEDIFNSNTNY